MSIKNIFITISILNVMLLSCNPSRKVVEKTIYIGAETKPCQLGEMQANCLQAKWTKDQKTWENFGQATDIEGFKYENGYQYELIVAETKIKNAPADASSVRYKIVKQVSKIKVNSANQNDVGDVKTIYIGAATKPCQLGEMQANCLQVKWTKDQKTWENFGQTTDIEGFTYENGYEYELIVKETKMDNVAADAADKKFKLVTQVNKVKSN